MKLKELGFKCILDNKEKRKVLQEALFEVGVGWTGAGDKTVAELEEPLYCIDQGELATYIDTEDYIADPIKELSYIKALAEIAKVEPESKRSRVDFYVSKDGRFCSLNGKEYSLGEIYSAIKEDVALKAFGGVQYIEPISGKKSGFRGAPPVCFYDGGFYDSIGATDQDGLPVFPHKIKFWTEE